MNIQRLSPTILTITTVLLTSIACTTPPSDLSGAALPAETTEQAASGADLPATDSAADAGGEATPEATAVPGAAMVPVCSGGQMLRYGDNMVGCRYHTTAWNDEAKDRCGDWPILMPSANGTCVLCVKAEHVDAVKNGQWSGFTMWDRSMIAPLPADFACNGCVKAPPGLIGFWTFEKSESELDVIDSSPEIIGSHWGNDGIYMGDPKIVAAKVMSGLELNLNTDSQGADISEHGEIDLDIPAASSGAGNLSVFAWVKPKPGGTRGTGVIADKREWVGGNIKGYQVFLVNGKLGLQLGDGSLKFANYTSTQASVPADGNFHFIAVVAQRDSAKVRFFVDGVMKEERSMMVGTNAVKGSLENAANLFLGRSPLSCSTCVFRGVLDEVAIFNQAVPDSAIAQIHSAGRYGMCRTN